MLRGEIILAPYYSLMVRGPVHHMTLSSLLFRKHGRLVCSHGSRGRRALFIHSTPPLPRGWFTVSVTSTGSATSGCLRILRPAMSCELTIELVLECFDLLPQHVDLRLQLTSFDTISGGFLLHLEDYFREVLHDQGEAGVRRFSGGGEGRGVVGS